MKHVMLLLVGLPGSGKSDFATQMEARSESDQMFGIWKRMNWDELRKTMPGYQEGQRFNKKREQEMIAYSHGIVRNWAAFGANVVIDNTNLNPKTVNDWRGLAEELGMEVQVHTMPTPHSECVSRDRKREGSARVGQAVIDRMALNYGLLTFRNDFVIVDMDGTLSDSSKRQRYVTGNCEMCGGSGVEVLMNQTEYYCLGAESVRVNCSTDSRTCTTCLGTGKIKKDWGRFFREVGQDAANPFVDQLVRAFSAAGYDIVIVSGRPMDQCGIITEDWLQQHTIPYSYLFMRHAGDTRDDTIIKKEILDKLPKNRIFCAADDRPRILRMWKENGINVIDVGNGVEF